MRRSVKAGTKYIREGRDPDAEQHQLIHITARKIPEKRRLRLLPPPEK